MRLNLEQMAVVHHEDLAAAVTDALGQAGELLARQLLMALPRVHLNMPVELLPEGLVVFVTEDSTAALPGFSGVHANIQSVQVHPHRGFTVHVTQHGYSVRPGLTDVSTLPPGIAYKFVQPGVETWHLAGKTLAVFNPVDKQPSIFATPLFTELGAALDDYSLKQVHESRCPILTIGWLNGKRIYWRQRPEIQVRRSLEAHLVSTLRDAVIEVEHVVDEDKEVDIVVRWNLAPQIALIECKWMGVSVSEEDANGARRITRFTQTDAVAGLGQLADYIDRKRPRAEGAPLVGHLVVIDGRRRHNRNYEPDRDFSDQELLYYEHREIVWPDELLRRPDLAQPHRMFCRPFL